MAVKSELEKRLSHCEVCKAGLGNLRMDTPLYCISCIEDMERLGMGPERYGRYRKLKGDLS